jgi:hypothetical protein
MGPLLVLSRTKASATRRRGRHDERRKVVCTTFPVKAKDGSVNAEGTSK